MWWQGKQYYTSHYFHQWYLVNSVSEKGKAKYRRHDSFLRLIKRIESYPLFVERGDIVLLTTQSLTTKQVDFNENKDLHAVLAANNFHVVYLISAAFQLACDAQNESTRAVNGTSAAEPTPISASPQTGLWRGDQIDLWRGTCTSA